MGQGQAFEHPPCPEPTHAVLARQAMQDKVSVAPSRAVNMSLTYELSYGVTAR